MMLLAVALSFAAFTALSLAMEKHQLELHGNAAASPRVRMRWRVLGWTLLCVSFALSVADRGWGPGPVLWLGTLTIAGLPITFGLYPWRQRWLKPLACGLPVLGLVAAVM